MASNKVSFDVLQKLLNENDTTIYKVAKEAGIATTVLYDWKSGRCQPKVDKMVLLANYFDVPLDYFISAG